MKVCMRVRWFVVDSGHERTVLDADGEVQEIDTEGRDVKSEIDGRMKGLDEVDELKKLRC